MSNGSVLRRARKKAKLTACPDDVNAGPRPRCDSHRKPMALVQHVCGSIGWQCAEIALERGERRIR